jgi:RNA polymerase sigma factor (sigma-70 family)
VYKWLVVDRPLAEVALVERARRGDDAAFATLVKEHQEIAFRTAYLITGSRADAEEATQDGFYKAYRALPRFRTGAPVRPWLLQIIANEARNSRRSRRRREDVTLRLAQQRAVEQLESPEGETLAAERRERLLAAVRELPEPERLAVSCRYLLGLSELETATVLEIPPGTVKSRLSRALARLRAAEETQ